MFVYRPKVFLYFLHFLKNKSFAITCPLLYLFFSVSLAAPVSVCVFHFHLELNGLPAAPVAHLEAGRQRAVTQLPGLHTVDLISVCVTHGALFSQHGSTVYGPDVLSVNDLVSSD